MVYRMGELRNKEVINVRDGGRIGFISDVEIDGTEAKLTAVVVYGRLRLFGLLGREEDVVIPFKDIALFGGDTVLVNFTPPARKPRGGFWRELWEKLGL